MKKLALSILCIIISFAVFAQSKKVAIFNPVDKSESKMAEVFREVLSTDLAKNKEYIPVERKLIKSVIKESEYQSSGMVDESKASELGKQMGADYVCVSLMKKVGQSYFLTAKIVDVTTAAVSIQERIMADNKSELYKKMVELSGQLFDIKVENKTDKEESNNCEDIDCKNGGKCVNDTCKCKEGYTGKYCEEQKTPQKIVVEKIIIRNFPSHKDNGDEWDYWTDYPDIYTVVYNTNKKQVYKQNSFFEEVTSEKNLVLTKGLPFSLNNVENSYTIVLYDYDSSDDDNYMGKISFTPYKDNNGFPETIKVKNIDFSYNLKVRYKF